MVIFMAITSKICPVCGKPFETNRHDKFYCSQSCKSKNDIIRKHICPTCGKSFWAGKGKIYCSRECKLTKNGAHMSEKIIEKPIQTIRKPVPTKGRKPLARKICPVCGTTFVTNRNDKYCSQQCRSKASWQRIRDTNEQARKLGLSYGQFATYKKLGLNPADFARTYSTVLKLNH